MRRFWKDGELREHPCGLYVLHEDVQAEIKSLRRQLAECQAERDKALGYGDRMNYRLAECERERDELKTWLEDQMCEAKDFAYKLEGKTVELATVTQERDELVAAVLAVCCDTEGRVVIHGSDGDRAVLQAALAKLGADATAPEGHNAEVTGGPLAARPVD